MLLLFSLLNLLTCIHSKGDLFTSWLRDDYLEWKEKFEFAVVKNTLVTAAQGHFEGPEVLSVIRGGGGRASNFITDANWPALTGIKLAVGIIQLSNDGAGGCGIIPFHGHPNCYEVMTTLEGEGGYAQIKPDGTVQHSRIMTKGAQWVMEHGAQHYYRNLNPNSIWKFEIAFDCSEVGSVSSWKWIGHLDAQLVKQFWGVSDQSAANLAIKPDDRLDKTSTRFIANCLDDRALHEAVRVANSDSNLYKAPGDTYPYPATYPYEEGSDNPNPVGTLGTTGSTLEFYTYVIPNAIVNKPPRVPHTVGRMEIKVGAIQNPVVVYSAHTVYHVIEGEVMIAMWAWNNKMSVETLLIHDLMLVPRGSVHFIVNTGSQDAVLLSHYDTAGAANNEMEFAPRIQVVSNFFVQKANLLQAVLRCSQAAAEDLAGQRSNHPLFETFTGSIDTLKFWAAGTEDYCPLGCPHNLPLTTLIETTQGVHVEVSWPEESMLNDSSVGLWTLLIISLIINVLFAVVLRSLMNFVGFQISSIWKGSDDMKRTNKIEIPQAPRATPTVYKEPRLLTPALSPSPVPYAAETPHWFYARNDQQFGPITEAELKQKLNKKEITWDTYVWHDVESDGWEPLSQCNFLQLVDDKSMSTLWTSTS